MNDFMFSVYPLRIECVDLFAVISQQPSVPHPAREAASPWILLIPLAVLLAIFTLAALVGYLFIVRPRKHATEMRRANRSETLRDVGFQPILWDEAMALEFSEAFSSFKVLMPRLRLWSDKQDCPTNVQVRFMAHGRIRVFDSIWEDTERDEVDTECTFIWLEDQQCQFAPVHVAGFGHLPWLDPLLRRIFGYSHPHPSLMYSCLICDQEGRSEGQLPDGLVAFLDSCKPKVRWPLRRNLGFNFVLKNQHMVMWSDHLVHTNDLGEFLKKAEGLHAAARREFTSIGKPLIAEPDINMISSQSKD